MVFKRCVSEMPFKYYYYKFHFRFMAYENYGGKKLVRNERNTIKHGALQLLCFKLQ